MPLGICNCKFVRLSASRNQGPGTERGSLGTGVSPTYSPMKSLNPLCGAPPPQQNPPAIPLCTQNRAPVQSGLLTEQRAAADRLVLPASSCLPTEVCIREARDIW
jgi:hypothetical protein